MFDLFDVDMTERKIEANFCKDNFEFFTIDKSCD
jgi:hypothetical protein